LLTQKSPNLGERNQATPTRRSEALQTSARPSQPSTRPTPSPTFRPPIQGRTDECTRQSGRSHDSSGHTSGHSSIRAVCVGRTDQHLPHQCTAVLADIDRSSTGFGSRDPKPGTRRSGRFTAAVGFPSHQPVRPASGGDNRACEGVRATGTKCRAAAAAPIGTRSGPSSGPSSSHVEAPGTSGLGVHGLRCISVNSPGGSCSRLLLTPSLALSCRRWPTGSLAAVRLLLGDRGGCWNAYLLPANRGRVLHLEAWQW
jgi:hypothetical protein